jgi:ABC-type nitrate/sulfonate/bicarbonate transport system substrate-binding protein
VEAATFRIGAHKFAWGSWDVVADRLGYFKEAGLKDYRMKVFKSGKDMRNAIIQNNIDIGTVGAIPFIISLSKGAKMTAVAATARVCGVMHISVIPKSKAKEFQGLKGVTFALAKGSSTHFAIQNYAIPRSGLKVSDINWLNKKSTDRVLSIVAGNAQAALLGDPTFEVARRKGIVREVENLCKYDPIWSLHTANPASLRRSQNQFVSYLKGWRKAKSLHRSDPGKFAEVYTKYLQEMGSKSDKKLILAIMNRLYAPEELSAKVRGNLNRLAGDLKKAGRIKRIPDLKGEDVLNNSVYEKAKAK